VSYIQKNTKEEERKIERLRHGSGGLVTIAATAKRRGEKLTQRCGYYIEGKRKGRVETVQQKKKR